MLAYALVAQLPKLFNMQILQSILYVKIPVLGSIRLPLIIIGIIIYLALPSLVRNKQKNILGISFRLGNFARQKILLTTNSVLHFKCLL